MRILPVNNNFNTYKITNSACPVFKSRFVGVDVFFKQCASDKNINIPLIIKRIGAEYGKIPVPGMQMLSRAVNMTNYKAFLNILSFGVITGSLSKIFTPEDSMNTNVIKILENTNEENRKFVEYYTSLGGLNSHIITDSGYELKDEIFNMKLKGFSPPVVDKIIVTLTPENKDAVKNIVNSRLFSDFQLPGYLNKLKPYSAAEGANVVSNIKNGLAEYLKNASENNDHPLRKKLNTQDFLLNGSDFVSIINAKMDNKVSIMDFLRLPFEDKKHFDKVLRDTGMMMGVICKNEKSAACNKHDRMMELSDFFMDNFVSLVSMVALTDKETVLQIFDRGFENAKEFIIPLRRLTQEDESLLATVIRHGKRVNKNGEDVNIPAKDKVYFYRLINTNRAEFVITLKPLVFAPAITPANKGDGVYVDFSNIENQVKYNVFKRCGFSDDEIKMLKPENLDWDLRYMHQLARFSNEALNTVIKSASKGEFKNFINDPFNKYGYANMKTKEAFEKSGCNYQAWLEGIPPESFEAGGEKLKISIWNRRPQSSIFNGTYTSCCTAIDGTQGDSMPHYLLHTIMNPWIKLYLKR